MYWLLGCCVFCEGFFSFSFTPNVLVHSGLRGVGEAVKAINENLLTCRCVRMCAYAYERIARGCARSCVYWGGRWKSGEEWERKWGRKQEGGVNEGRKGNQWKIGRWSRGWRKGKAELEKSSRCAKGECGGRIAKYSSKNPQKLGSGWGKTIKKWASQDKKRARSLEESPEIGFETWKSGKNGDFGAKKVGWGRGEKMGFTADFAMLWSGKMGANEIFSHFFSVISCRECRNALPLHSQSGSNALAREGYARKRRGSESAAVIFESLT